MKIVMVASESNPLVKTGGLADVVYSLSRELVKAGHEVFVFLPYYKKIKDKNLKIIASNYDYIYMAWRHQYVGVLDYVVDGIQFKLIDNEQYFNRDGLYGYDDDGERFAFFTLAVQKIIQSQHINPDIIHVHDWQAGMLPAVMKGAPLEKKKYHYVLTIHNPAFKGYLDRESLGNIYNLSDDMYTSGAVRFEDRVSSLKAGIYFADKITTVSPTHRNELLNRDSSQGLSDVLEFRKDDFVGIVNGIDVNEFNPETDNRIAANFSSKSYKTNRKKCKKAMLDRFNLKNHSAPTYGLVSRLTWQKGIDLILTDAEYLLSQGANIIMLGSGEYNLEKGFQSLRDRYPNQVGIFIGYNDDLAHQVYAGLDFFLMPSLFEPCGIGQIIAQRYGALPIARETGGLVDTVHAEVDGFTFSEYNPHSLYCVLKRTLEVYKDKVFMDKLIKKAMSLDRSWLDSMNKYVDVYLEAMKK